MSNSPGQLQGMKETVIAYPESLPGLLRVSDEELATELRFLLAGKLFELGKLTSGKASEMARLPRVEFLGRLSSYGFSAINLEDEQIEAEIKAAGDVAR